MINQRAVSSFEMRRQENNWGYLEEIVLTLVLVLLGNRAALETNNCMLEEVLYYRVVGR